MIFPHCLMGIKWGISVFSDTLRHMETLANVFRSHGASKWSEALFCIDKIKHWTHYLEHVERDDELTTLLVYLARLKTALSRDKHGFINCLTKQIIGHLLQSSLSQSDAYMHMRLKYPSYYNCLSSHIPCLCSRPAGRNMADSSELSRLPFAHNV